MNKYPPRSEGKKQRNKFKDNEIVNKKELESLQPETDNNPQKVDVLNLPSRKQVHQSKEKITEKNSRVEKRRIRKTTTKTFRFPLVKVLLILFFILVTVVVTYPLWIERI